MRTIKLFLYFCLTVLAKSLSAQDVFELTYQFKSDSTKTIYKGLLFKYPGDTGFLRLTAINNKTKKRVLYDFSISLNKYDYGKRPLEGGLPLTDSVKENYWYCWSENFNVIEGTEIFDFDYLRLWFKRNSTTSMVEPCLKTPFNIEGRSLGTTEVPKVIFNTLEADTSGNNMRLYEGTGILSFNQLKNTSFTKAFLNDFFTSTELFYEGLYTKKQVLAVRKNIKPSFYLISVVNIKDPDIGVNCINDGKKITSYFKRVAIFLGSRFIEKKVQGANFSLNGVKAAIKSINPGTDDVVIFHYSGHGFSYGKDENYPLPQIALWHGDAASRPALRASTINIEEIFTLIKAKKARLNLVLSDCCNTLIETRRESKFDNVASQIPPSYYYMNKRTAIALFIQTQASMVISAAKKGQAANCSTSYDGLFTTSIINSIRIGLKSTSSNPQWMDIIRQTEGETSELASMYNEQQNIIYRICNPQNATPCREDMGYRIKN